MEQFQKVSHTHHWTLKERQSRGRGGEEMLEVLMAEMLQILMSDTKSQIEDAPKQTTLMNSILKL
jgi:hypothetical protein